MAGSIILVITTGFVASILSYIMGLKTFQAILHAVPLSIMSSAIIIPSIGSLASEKKEFLIYESTFSDVLGIMIFYFLVQSYNATSTIEVVGSISLSIILTLLTAIIYFVYKLIFWNTFDLGIAPLIIGIFGFASIQVLLLGIIGEYVGRINIKVNQKPQFVIKDSVEK